MTAMEKELVSLSQETDDYNWMFNKKNKPIDRYLKFWTVSRRHLAKALAA
jgi:hypothetical protein